MPRADRFVALIALVTFAMASCFWHSGGSGDDDRHRGGTTVGGHTSKHARGRR